MIYLLDCYSCVVWQISLRIKREEEIDLLLALELRGNLRGRDDLLLLRTAVDERGHGKDKI